MLKSIIIDSEGTPARTTIRDAATGTPLTGVKSITLEIDAETGRCQATLTFIHVQVSAVANDVIETRPKEEEVDAVPAE